MLLTIPAARGKRSALARLPLVLFPLLLLGTPAHASTEVDARAVPPGARLSFLDNGQIKVGVDLNHGGAIVYLSRDGGPNRVNNFDFGRQVQLSFYSGPVPYTEQGQQPSAHWAHLGWNPVQTGDDFKNASALLAHENDGRRLHVRCQPLQWPLNRVPGECTFDSWLELDGPVVKARARLTNARKDPSVYPARLQELPAVYANAPYHRVVSYTGSQPFTQAGVSVIPKAAGRHPWSFWTGTEGWAALLDGQDQGLGLITPGRIDFTGGFAGQPGPNDPLGNSTGYLAGQAREILDSNIVYEFQYELVPGSLAEIRARAAAHRPVGLPSWTFARDRQGWFHHHAVDSGWPLREHWEVRLEQPDPQLTSPLVFWHAEQAPYLVVEAALRGGPGQAEVYWQGLDAKAPEAGNHLSFPWQADGEFHVHVVHLASNPSYRGALKRLRMDPLPAGAPGKDIRIRSIRLLGEPPSK